MMSQHSTGVGQLGRRMGNLRDAVAYSGMKNGKSVLVDFDRLNALLDQLPHAQIRPPNDRPAA